jgi:hypothetical protein
MRAPGIRTMIAFAMCVDDWTLARHSIARCPSNGGWKKMSIVKPHLVLIYEELIGGIEEPQLKAAVKRLIAHSRGRPAWLYQRMRRWRREAAASRVKRLWDRLF